MGAYSTIAVFRALHLGDMLCIIPTIRAIRRAFPRASITLIGLPWQRDLVKRFARYFAGWPGLPEQAADASRILDCLNEIRNHPFDLIFQMQRNGILTNSLCMLWNGRRVAGLRKANE